MLVRRCAKSYAFPNGLLEADAATAVVVVWKESLTVWGLEPATMGAQSAASWRPPCTQMARPNLLAKGPVTAHLTAGGLLTPAIGHGRGVRAAGSRPARP